MKQRSITLVATVLMLSVPIAASAELEIQEVMYDPEGADAGREWLEVVNTGEVDEVIYGGTANGSWRLHERSTSAESPQKRTFSFTGGASSVTLSAGTRAVIAKDPALFLEDYPEYDGVLFSSSMSLTNSEGRELTFYDGNQVRKSSPLIYTPLPEASGTGASLQLQTDGSWIAALPTPGEENSATPFSVKEGGDADVGDDFIEYESDWPFSSERIYIDIGENRRVFIGEELEFSADVRFRNGDRVRSADVVWAFGDGDGDRGGETEHVYGHEGMYRVLARVSHEGKLYQDAIRVHVLDDEESVALGEIAVDHVEIVNATEYELNLSGWSLESAGEVKDFALGTHLLPHESVDIPFATDSLVVSLHKRSGGLVAEGSLPDGVFLYNKDVEEIMKRIEAILGELGVK